MNSLLMRPFEHWAKRVAGDFDEQADRVRAACNLSDEEVATVKQRTLELAETTPKTISAAMEQAAHETIVDWYEKHGDEVEEQE